MTNLEIATFAEDVAFDSRHAALLAKRLLDGVNESDVAAAALAIELLADRTVVHGTTAADQVRLFSTTDGSLLGATDVAARGIDVVLLGLSHDRLIAVTVPCSDAPRVVTTPPDTFSLARFAEWSKTFPYEYSDARTAHVFYTSTASIGVSDLPARAVIIPSAELQAFPVNLLNVNDDVAGVAHRLATAPSVTWLTSALNAPRPILNRRVAWIPIADESAELSALNILCDRLQPTFDSTSILVARSREVPSDLSGAEVAIVGAHGATSRFNRYFRAISDDKDFLMSSGGFAYTLRDTGLVILFVCSGGRLDRNPFGTATLGLSKQLLQSGCRTIIAPSWPLEVGVPPHWLPEFLFHWDCGLSVVDACFEANLKVRNVFGSDFAKCLAMSVYGDPLLMSSRSARK